MRIRMQSDLVITSSLENHGIYFEMRDYERWLPRTWIVSDSVFIRDCILIHRFLESPSNIFKDNVTYWVYIWLKSVLLVWTCVYVMHLKCHLYIFQCQVLE